MKISVWNDYTNTSNSKTTSNSWSDVTVEEIQHRFYRIKCKQYTFIADIFPDELAERDIIKFDGIKKTCVFFSVYWDDNEKLYPNLEGVSFDAKCSFDDKFQLQRKSGTILMLKCALKFLLALYPMIKGIMFKDQSVLKCLGDVRINLSSFYIAKYGRTWYQSKFDAEPLNVTSYCVIKFHSF
jgi:hypothetical protein